MSRKILTTFMFLAVCVGSFAQCTIRGKVTDGTGETVIGANVVLKADMSQGTVTDLDGNYTLKLTGDGPQVIVYSFIGLESKEVTLDTKNNSVIVQNMVLREKNIELGEFEVEGKARRASDTYLDRMKVNAPVSFDFISSDAIKRSGDSDAAQAVRRVTGVSTVGAFVTVRGLADRYLVTTVNGARVPTLDPLTNNLRLDLFPTGLLDNIIITKTLSPDMPGDWAGAYMSLNASDFPQQLQVNFTTTVGYNTNATSQDIVSSERSSTDWLGYDDGLRAIPDGVSPNISDFPDFVEPNLYQQLGVLGVGSYLNSIGVDGANGAFQTSTMGTSSTLQHLGLTQLGLLGQAQLYDANAIQNAVSTYNNTYSLAYFSPILNADLASANQAFDNANWRVSPSKGRPNFSQSFSIGNQLTLFKKRKEQSSLGYLVGFRYNAETEHDPNSVQQRSGEKYDDTILGDEQNPTGVQALTVETNSWSAVANLGFKLDRNNSFSLLVMPSRMGQNNARYLEFLNSGLGTDTFVSEEQYYEQRRLWLYQYGSKHLIPALDLTVEVDASYSDGQRDLLDLRIVSYVKPPPGEPINSVEAQLGQPGRVYRFMEETMLDTRLGFELPLSEQGSAKKRKLKFGGAFRRNERTNEQAYFQIRGAVLPQDLADPANYEMQADGRFRSLYTPFGTFKDNDIGILDVSAAYVMTDYTLGSRWRMVGGVRAEYTDLLSDIKQFYDDGVAADDPIRGTVGDVAIQGASAPEPKPAIPGTIERWDLLPSINLIYRLVNDEQAPTNLRLSYFRSLARPSFREFSVVQLYDYQLRSFTFGNPDLTMTRIDNYDARVERIFKNQNSVSVSTFYKRFLGHIELVQTQAGGFTWRNADLSEVYGLELEGKVKLSRSWEWRGNFSWMYSRSDLSTTLGGNGGGVEQTYTTRMFGQAPWLVNAMLSFSPDSSGFTASVAYNVQGPKLAITNAETAPEAVRGYEMPRHMLDLTLTKRFGKHWGLTARARNLLNSPLRRSYLFASGYDYDFDSYAWGTEYSLGISYVLK